MPRLTYIYFFKLVSTNRLNVLQFKSMNSKQNRIFHVKINLQFLFKSPGIYIIYIYINIYKMDLQLIKNKPTWTLYRQNIYYKCSAYIMNDQREHI